LGVEVTELWQHGTDARLSNVSGYFESLLNGGEVIHADDRTTAKVEKIQLIPQDSFEPLEEMDAIVRPHPSPSECAKLLDAALTVKEKRVSVYMRRCTQVDLVIDDRSNLFWFSDFDQLIRPISSASCRGHVTRSSFREIFLLTYTKKGPKVRVPLKASLLMEDLLVLEELLAQEAPELCDQLYSESQSSPIAISVLATALSHISGVVPMISVEEGRLGISLGSMTLHWTSEGKIIRDYTCIPEQITAASDQLLLSSWDAKISRTIAGRRNNHQATLALAFPVNSP